MNCFKLLPAARRLAVTALCGTMLMLAGCAVYSTADDPLKLSPQSALTPVAVSITANTGEISGFDKILLERMTQDERRSDIKLIIDTLMMKKVVPGMARDTSLFIGALPAGDYEFTQLNAGSTGKLLRIYGLGRFRVEAGKPIDLGRVIVTRANFKIGYGRSGEVVSNAELMQRFAPEYSKLFGANAGTGWTKPRWPKDPTEAFARSHPAAATCLTEMSDGRVAAASRMGAILMRAREGNWRVLNSRYSETLSCVLPVDLPNAELLAVGEFGIMVRKPRDSEQLLPIDTGNLPPGNLLNIAGNAGSGWYVLHRSGNEFNVFHSQQLEDGNWQSENKFTLPGSWAFGTDAFWSWQDAHSLGYALESGTIAQVDLATGKWSEHKGPPDANLSGFRHLLDGTETVLVKAGLAGRFPDAYISKDQQNWTRIVSPFKVLMSPVVPVKGGKLLMEAGMYNKPELHVSSDNGQTWAPYASYPLHGSPLELPSGLMFNVDGEYSGIISIHSSSDAGKTWKMEHTSLALSRPGQP
jgi:hypothetical protein